MVSIDGLKAPNNLRQNSVKIYLFRHGETDWNVEERFQGHMDIPLNENGKKQAQALIPYFQQNPIQAILSSDLSRAYESARIIAEAIGVQIHVDPGLREAFLGKAQGLTRHEIEKEFGVELALRWRSSHVSDADISYPDGETGNQIIQRAFQSLRRFLESAPYPTPSDGLGERFAVATHGGVIRRILQQLLPPGSPPVSIANGIVHQIEYHRGNQIFSVVSLQKGSEAPGKTESKF